MASASFKSLAKKTNERFQKGEDETLPCTFSGFHLERGWGRCPAAEPELLLAEVREAASGLVFLSTPFDAYATGLACEYSPGLPVRNITTGAGH